MTEVTVVMSDHIDIKVLVLEVCGCASVLSSLPVLSTVQDEQCAKMNYKASNPILIGFAGGILGALV